jgi:hypothetical protein
MISESIKIILLHVESWKNCGMERMNTYGRSYMEQTIRERPK